MSLLPVVEKYLRTHQLAASRFGRLVTGDPRFVFDLRRGREPRAITRDHVLAQIRAGVGAGMDAAAKEGTRHASAR